MKRRPGCFTLLCAVTVCLAARSPVAAQPPADQPSAEKSLEQLLERVRRGWDTEREEDAERERRFRREKSERQRLLAEARAALAEAEARSRTLEKEFEENELRIAELEESLQERLGTLGEAFGVVRQVAGDTLAHVQSSLVSAQIPGREGFLRELAQSKALPSADALERLWFTLQQEMTEAGRTVRFPATVITADGDEVEREVVRIGVFNALAGGRYLQWLSDVGRLAELGRQPAPRYLATAGRFEKATDGLVPLAVDPSRGAILSLLVQTPSARERIDQGGMIGAVIIALGAMAGLLALARLLSTFRVSRKVAAQRRQPGKPAPDNPLGRVLSIYETNPEADAETLELKLNEGILRESAQLDRFLWLVKAVSVVAPLLGLLGTVTGMIRTFQAITLYGTGDPKLMAGGISEALVTTMLGLSVAIPLLLAHALAASGSRRVVEVLEEQSAGLVAVRAEERNAAR